MSRLFAGLRRMGCTAEEGIRFEGKHFPIAAYRSRLARIVVAPMFVDEWFIVAFKSKLTREKLASHIQSCNEYAVSSSPAKSLIKRLVGGFSAIYCIVVAEEVGGDTLDFVREQPPQRMPWAWSVPIVCRLPSGDLTYFEKIPVLGGAFCREIRKVVKTELASIA